MLKASHGCSGRTCSWCISYMRFSRPKTQPTRRLSPSFSWSFLCFSFLCFKHWFLLVASKNEDEPGDHVFDDLIRAVLRKIGMRFQKWFTILDASSFHSSSFFILSFSFHRFISWTSDPRNLSVRRLLRNKKKGKDLEHDRENLFLMHLLHEVLPSIAYLSSTADS